MSDLEAIKALARETVNAIEQLLKKHNLLIIKSGIVKKVEDNKYTVSIEKKEYVINSQLTFAVGDVVSVLTDTRMTGVKFLLG